jgi:lipopolysaccharide transport system permease protein
MWRYRRLLRFFAFRAVEKLYRRTVLGWGWILLRPLIPLLVNTLVFGGLLGLDSEGVPYFLFLITGMSLWELFSDCVTWGTRSLDLNRGFLSRIYVPRLIMPIATMTPAFVEFVIVSTVLAVSLVYFRVSSGVWYITPGNLGWAAASLALTVFFALGISLWTSVPALQARDVRFTLAYVLGFWLYLTPVLYPISVAPRYAWLLWLNPLAALVNTYKFGVLGIGTVDVRQLGMAFALSLVLFASGLWFFSRAEADAADKV